MADIVADSMARLSIAAWSPKITYNEHSPVLVHEAPVSVAFSFKNLDALMYDLALATEDDVELFQAILQAIETNTFLDPTVEVARDEAAKVIQYYFDLAAQLSDPETYGHPFTTELVTFMTATKKSTLLPTWAMFVLTYIVLSYLSKISIPLDIELSEFFKAYLANALMLLPIIPERFVSMFVQKIFAMIQEYNLTLSIQLW